MQRNNPETTFLYTVITVGGLAAQGFSEQVQGQSCLV